MSELIIIYKSFFSKTLYTTSWDGSKWDESVAVVNGKSGKAFEAVRVPNAVVLNNRLHMLYTADEKFEVTETWFDGDCWVSNGPIWSTSQRGAIWSDFAPTSVAYKGGLYTVYAHANNRIRMTRYNGSTWDQDTPVQINGVEARMQTEPAAVIFHDMIVLVYTDMDDEKIKTITYDGQMWADDNSISRAIPDLGHNKWGGPCAVVYKGELHVITIEDQSLYLQVTKYDGTTWSKGKKIIVDNSYLPTGMDRLSAAVFQDKINIIYVDKNAKCLNIVSYDGKYWSGATAISNQKGTIKEASTTTVVTSRTPRLKKDWMSQIPHTTPISEINIPGSHDAAAISKITSPYACHNYSISEQLNHGIRLLDVRLQIKDNGTGCTFMTCHGDRGSAMNLNTYQTFSSLLDECGTFLATHSREFIIMSLSVDDWSNTSNKKKSLTLLKKMLDLYPTTSQKDIPTIGAVRGKIFLYNRINDDKDLGVPINWGGNTDGENATSNNNRTYDVYVQDRYKNLPVFGSDDKKLKLVTDAFKKKNASNIVWNFASGTRYAVIGVYPQNLILDYFGKVTASQRLATFGWTLFDYPFNYYETNTYSAMNIVELIISSNTTPRYKLYNETYKCIDDGLGDL